MPNKFFRLIKLILLLFLFSCQREMEDKRLAEINKIVSEQPLEALKKLEKIDRKNLSEKNASFYDFLTIKARDKAYIDHTTDSVILKLIPYYINTNLHKEILYYAGRVYSDLGDYPTALDYFQQALNIDNNDSGGTKIQGNILSQTARLMNELRLYNQAIPYLEEVIKIDKIEKDTFNLAYDLQLLGSVYMHQTKYDEAEEYFKKAYEFSKSLSANDICHNQIYLAAIKYKKGDIDSAISLIRRIPEKAHELDKNLARIYASDIYLAAGRNDSAYYYAKELIESEDVNNRKNGYRNIFESKLIEFVPHDSLKEYINRYYNEIEEFYNNNEAQQALLQQSMYNYKKHEREKFEAEQKTKRLLFVLSISIFLILVSLLIILILSNRRKKLLLKLNDTSNELRRIQNLINKTENVERIPLKSSNLNKLQQQIKEQLDNLNKNAIENVPVDPELINSEIYKIVENYLSENKTIPEKSEIWKKLAMVVSQHYPKFDHHIQLMVGNKLKAHDYQMLLLIKCGFTPTDATVLLGRTKGTISYRRKNLNKIIFGGIIDINRFDDIIRYI